MGSSEKIVHNQTWSQDLLSDLRHMQKDGGSFCDVVLVGSQGTKFPMHSAVLAAASGFFREALKSSVTVQCVFETDISDELWTMLMEFIYSGRVVIDESIRQSFIETAEHFEINVLDNSASNIACNEGSSAVTTSAQKVGCVNLNGSDVNCSGISDVVTEHANLSCGMEDHLIVDMDILVPENVKCEADGSRCTSSQSDCFITEVLNREKTIENVQTVKEVDLVKGEKEMTIKANQLITDEHGNTFYIVTDPLKMTDQLDSEGGTVLFLEESSNLDADEAENLFGVDGARFLSQQYDQSAEGVALKQGQWSADELVILQTNIDKYCKEKNVTVPQHIMFESTKQVKGDFFRTICKGLNRPEYAVFRRAIRMYDDKNYAGKYSREDVKRLRQLHRRHGNNWQGISRILGKSIASIKERCMPLNEYSIESLQESSEQNDENTDSVAADNVAQMEADDEHTTTLVSLQGNSKTMKTEPADCSPSSIFTCAVCGEKFATKRSLSFHSKTHTGELGHHCSYCGKFFRKRMLLISHEAVAHTNAKPFACDRCLVSFRHGTSLALHRKTCLGVDESGRRVSRTVAQCQECGRTFKAARSFQQHLLIHTGELPYICGTCGKRFRKKGNMTKHERTHSGYKPFACEKCGRRFSAKNILSNHCIIAHQEGKRTKNFQCKSCPKSYYLKSELIRHAKLKHQFFGVRADEQRGDGGGTGAREAHRCSFCELEFKDKTKLTIHTRSHTGERPYVCSSCRKAFKDKGTWQQHMQRTHIKDKHFRCDVCLETFFWRMQLQKHVKKRHTVVKCEFAEVDSIE